MVRIYTEHIILFSGYIPCITIEQSWLQKGIINLSATVNLNRLDEYKPSIFVTKGMYTLMEIIQDCLSFTSLDLPIYVNCTLRETTKTAGTNTCFDQTWADCDLFYKNNIELDDCLTILNKILTAFTCMIYYYNDAWYIERGKDLGTDTKYYIRYESSSSTASTVSDTNTHIAMGSSFLPIKISQRIGYNPGLKRIEVTLNEKSLFNLTNYYWEGIETGESVNYMEYTSPDLKAWEINSDLTYTILNNFAWNRKQNNLNVINKAISTSNPLLITGETPVGGIEVIDPSFPGRTLAQKYQALRNSAEGVQTKIKVSYNSTNKCKLTISLKFVLPQSLLDYVTDPTFFFSPQFYPHHRFFVRFYLYWKDPNDVDPDNRWWIKYNSTTDKYQIVNRVDMIASALTPSIVIDPVIIKSLGISMAQFTNEKAFYNEFSMDVELDDTIKEVTGDNPVFILGLCQLGFHSSIWTGSEDETNCNFYIKDNIYGDFAVTVDNESDNNLITAEINNNFVNIEQDTLDLYDSINYNILNGLLIDGEGNHSTLWYDLYSSFDKSLVKHFIEDRFQLFNKVRRTISGDFRTLGILNDTVYSRTEVFEPLHLPNHDWQDITGTLNGNIYAIGGSDIYRQTGGLGDFIALAGAGTHTWINITSDGNDVYVTEFFGDIYKQTAGAGNFIALGQATRAWWGIAAKAGTVYATVTGGDIYKSTGGGSFTALGQASLTWHGIAIHPSGDVYAVVSNGDIYKQTAGAGDFIALGLTNRVYKDIVIDAYGNIFVSADLDDIYVQWAGTTTFVGLGLAARHWLGLGVDHNNNIYLAVSTASDILKRTCVILSIYQHLKPFTMIDTTVVSNKTFYVNGYQYNIEENTYENMSLLEYVSDDGIS
jgi:hypothetical protein